jgi:hypothetical protein
VAIVLQQYETFEGRDHEIDHTRTRQYRRTFQVVMSHRTADPIEVRLALIIPRLWNPYFGANGTVDLGSWCKRVRPRQDTQDPYLWHVECLYDSKIDRPDLNLIENPLLRPADISWDGVAVMKPLEKDREGTPITSSATERFDPPAESEDFRMLLRIERNLATYRALLYHTYFNAVNSDPWMSFQPGQVRCMKISGTRQFENGIFFWRTTYEFQIRQGTESQKHIDAWALKILDRGYFHVNAQGKRALMRDLVTGALLSTPALLNGTGGRLAAGGEPVFMTYYIYPELPFSKLYLG